MNAGASRDTESARLAADRGYRNVRRNSNDRSGAADVMSYRDTRLAMAT
jgi:hypothetical protein